MLCGNMGIRAKHIYFFNTYYMETKNFGAISGNFFRQPSVVSPDFVAWAGDGYVIAKKPFGPGMVVSDLDGTIFSRDEQLKEDPGFAENRGDSGYQYMIEKYGSEEAFIERFFLRKAFPQDIVKELQMKVDSVILTS